MKDIDVVNRVLGTLLRFLSSLEYILTTNKIWAISLKAKTQWICNYRGNESTTGLRWLICSHHNQSPYRSSPTPPRPLWSKRILRRMEETHLSTLESYNKPSVMIILQRIIIRCPFNIFGIPVQESYLCWNLVFRHPVLTLADWYYFQPLPGLLLPTKYIQHLILSCLYWHISCRILVKASTHIPTN